MFSQLSATAWPGEAECCISLIEGIDRNVNCENKSVLIHLPTPAEAVLYLFWKLRQMVSEMELAILVPSLRNFLSNQQEQPGLSRSPFYITTFLQ